MDVYKALSELYAEKKRLDIAISALEKRAASAVRPDDAARSRRGRRSMSAQEREEVSRRMSRYWASRRGSSSNAESANGRSAESASAGLTQSAHAVPGMMISASQSVELV